MHTRLHAFTVIFALQALGCAMPMEGETRPEEPVGMQTATLSDYSCEERADSGYVRGERFSIDVVTVQGKPVEVATANAYLAMANAAEADGVNIRIISGFRTMEQQRYLYNCYTSCSCNSCNLAARPGYSNHQSGHALDLNTSTGSVLRWLGRNGGRFGFARTVPSEDWHWEFWGENPGGPCGRVEPPTRETCAPVPNGGGTIEETSGCFYARGPSAYWRNETGAGHGGGLLWTHAFQSDTPSNWARWYLDLEAADTYAVEVWAEPGFAMHRAARYVVRHDGVEDEVIVDLSGASGWTELGTFGFASGADQHLSLYDHSATEVAAEQRIPADAIRLVPVSEEPIIDDPPFEEPTMDEPATDEPALDEPAMDEPALDEPALDEPGPDGAPGLPRSDGRPTGISGGCAVMRASANEPALGWLVALAALAWWRQRRP